VEIYPLATDYWMLVTDYKPDIRMKTIVVGLGMVDRPDITVTEASVGGLRLMELLEGYDQVVLIDAIITKNGNEKGTIYRLTLDDLREISPTQHSASAHDTSLVTALDAGRKLGMHLPEKFTIFAVEVENVMDFSDQPTPAIAEAIPKVTTAVLKELQLPHSDS
jgi:hydrogenase maturation protease